MKKFIHVFRKTVVLCALAALTISINYAQSSDADAKAKINQKTTNTKADQNVIQPVNYNNATNTSIIPSSKSNLKSNNIVTQKNAVESNDVKDNTFTPSKNDKSSKQETQIIPQTNNADDKAPVRLGEHGPFLNDPDFTAKKEEWIKNYPEEYYSYTRLSSDQQNNNVPQQINSAAEKTNERLGEHGPLLNDPDFAVKKNEWIKNYPDEYKNMNQNNSQQSKSLLPKHYNNAIDGNPKRLGEHGPFLNDPDFIAKKEEWIKNYPEEVKSLNQTNSSHNNNNGLQQNIINNDKTQGRLGEHGPFLNDPDFDVKKASWIKNYPEEYNALINNSSNSSQNKPVPPDQIQPLTKTTGQAPDKSSPGFDATLK